MDALEEAITEALDIYYNDHEEGHGQQRRIKLRSMVLMVSKRQPTRIQMVRRRNHWKVPDPEVVMKVVLKPVEMIRN